MVKNNPAGGFYYYKWNKINETILLDKCSYVQLFKEYNWLIGAGFYLDEINQSINDQEKILRRDQQKSIILILIILFVLLFLEGLIILHFNKRFKSDFERFFNFFNSSQNSFNQLNISALYFDEFKRAGAAANKMIILREETETKLIKEQQKSAESDRLKSAFLANMSHEIRTPMNAIMGFSDLLFASLKDEKQRSQIDAIRSSGKNLLRIINDILDLSKIEAGKMVIQRESTNIQVIIKEVETIFAFTTKEKGIKFLVNIPKEIPTALLLDETRIRQILFNLIGNAVKFTDKGEVTLSVMRKNKGGDKIDLIITVKDTGIGIAADQLKLVFEAFTQQDGQRSAQYGGTGLGLTITRRLVEMMGGNITLSSEPGLGCLFTITLPDIEIIEEAEKESLTDSFDPSALFFEKGSVLIADDNQENRHFLVDLLSHFPLTIYEAENGAEAIDKAMFHLPEVILMDFKMPVMNGREAIEKLKEQVTTKKIPIIALSASSLEVLEEQYGAGLFDDFLMKPLIASELLEILKKYLKFHQVAESMSSEPEYSPYFDSNLTTKQKDQLPGLIVVLENEFIPIFADVLKKQVIGQIKIFGEQIYALGKAHSNPMITDFGKELTTYANNFEIGKMMKKLATFPALVNNLKKLI